MCDVATSDLINEILDEWVDSGKIFTAYEVSREVRNRWTADRGRCPRHGEIKKDIHTMMEVYSEYRRELMDVGAPDQAWVYHHEDDDPSKYQPLNRSNLNQIDPGRVSQPAQPNTDPSHTVPIDLGDPDDMAKVPPYSVNNLIASGAYPSLVDGLDHGSIRSQLPGPAGTTVVVGSADRLLLKAADMREIGFSPLDTAYIIPDAANQRVIVTPDMPKDVFDFACKTVTGDNEVRLHQDTFKKAGIPGKNYTVNVDKANRRIEIKAA